MSVMWVWCGRGMSTSSRGVVVLVVQDHRMLHLESQLKIGLGCGLGLMVMFLSLGLFTSCVHRQTHTHRCAKE